MSVIATIMSFCYATIGLGLSIAKATREFFAGLSLSHLPLAWSQLSDGLYEDVHKHLA